MANEVKALIASLTSERNSIDRAIQALQQMHEVKNGADTPRPVLKVKSAKRLRRAETGPRLRMSPALKAAIVTHMRDAQPGYAYAAAQQLAREHGANVSTIYTRWNAWKLDPAVQAELAKLATESEAIPA